MFIEEVEGIINGEIQLNPLFEFIQEGEWEGKIIGELKKKKELIHDEKMKGAGV